MSTSIEHTTTKVKGQFKNIEYSLHFPLLNQTFSPELINILLRAKCLKTTRPTKALNTNNRQNGINNNCPVSYVYPSPISLTRNANLGLCRGFVNMSANCHSVETLLISTSPSVTHAHKNALSECVLCDDETLGFAPISQPLHYQPGVLASC